MNGFNEIIEKIKDVISNESDTGKVFDKDVAAELNISQATFATMKKRGAIPYKELMEFCAKRKLSINWLFYDQSAGMLVEETEKFFRVKYYSSVSASAGGGSEVLGEDYEIVTIDRKFIESFMPRVNKEDIKPEQIDAVNVNGDSMEPTIKNGSIVFVDRSENKISKDGIFIVRTPGGLFIKRINKKVDGTIELISDNRLYGPEIVAPSEIEVLGKVVGEVDRF